MTHLTVSGDPLANAKGVGWAVLAVGLFSFMYVSGKLTGNFAGASQIVWLRYVGGLITVLVLAPICGRRSLHFRTGQVHIHFIRAACGGFGSMAAIYAATHMTVANATAIGLLDGLFTVVLGILLLGERVSIKQWGAAAICLLGAMIIVAGGGFRLQTETSMLLPALVALSGALLVAAENILIKRLARSEDALIVLFYVNLFGAALFAIPAFLQWHGLPTSHTILFLLLGPLAIAGQACNIQAFKLADAAVIGPIRYVWIVFGAAFGWLLFHEKISSNVFLGSILILSGGVMLATRKQERECNKKRRHPDKAA